MRIMWKHPLVLSVFGCLIAVSPAQIKNAAAYREKELKAAETSLKEAKKGAEAAGKRMTDMERQHGQNQLEIEELKKETLNFQAQLEKVIANIAGYQENIKDLMKTTGALRELHILVTFH